MAIVVFDPADFRARYPQFGDGTSPSVPPAPGQPISLTDAQLLNAFDIACQVVNNSNSSPVPYNPDNGVMKRKVVLYAFVCHLATMALRALTGQSGPVASATEGSASVSFALPPLQGRDAYFNQSPCGQLYLHLIKPYVVGGRYYPACNSHPWG